MNVTHRKKNTIALNNKLSINLTYSYFSQFVYIIISIYTYVECSKVFVHSETRTDLLLYNMFRINNQSCARGRSN